MTEVGLTEAQFASMVNVVLIMGGLNNGTQGYQLTHSSMPCPRHQGLAMTYGTSMKDMAATMHRDEKTFEGLIVDSYTEWIRLREAVANCDRLGNIPSQQQLAVLQSECKELFHWTTVA